MEDINTNKSSYQRLRKYLQAASLVYILPNQHSYKHITGHLINSAL